MPIQDIYAYFKTHSNADSDLLAFTCKDNEPSFEDVEEFEKIIGFHLPEEFRDFTMSSLGGLYMEVKEELWPRPKAYDVGPYWSFMYAIKVFGIAEGIPDWLDIRQKYDWYTKEFDRPDLVPFLQLEGSADAFCFTPEGNIVEFLHDNIDSPDPITLTFSELLMEQIADLEERKEKKKALLRQSIT